NYLLLILSAVELWDFLPLSQHSLCGLNMLYIMNKFLLVILRVKAQEFADRMSINDFKVSPGWVTNFKKRHNLSQFARQGEGNSAPLEDLPRFRNELQQLIQLYPVENVFNCDETALFYHMDPVKTLAHG